MLKTIAKAAADRLYHGSSKKYDELQPMPSKVLEGEPAVFATPSELLAMTFSSPWTDDDLELGSVNGQDYLKEKYPQAFEKIFGSRVGYVHVLPDGSFSSDPRLMPSERISKENVKVEKVKKISDLLKALKQQNKMILARHGDLLPWERIEFPEKTANVAADKLYRDRTEVYALDPKHRVFGGVWDKDKSFAAPGGGVDPGETPEQAAVREFLEETGYTLKNPVLLPQQPVVNEWSDAYRATKPDRAHYSGSRTMFVGGELGDRINTDKLDAWEAQRKRTYPLERAIKLMGIVDTPKGKEIHKARLAVLKQLLEERQKRHKKKEKKASTALARWVAKKMLALGSKGPDEAIQKVVQRATRDWAPNTFREIPNLAKGAIKGEGLGSGQTAVAYPAIIKDPTQGGFVGVKKYPTRLTSPQELFEPIKSTTDSINRKFPVNGTNPIAPYTQIVPDRVAFQRYANETVNRGEFANPLLEMLGDVFPNQISRGNPANLGPGGQIIDYTLHNPTARRYGIPTQPDLVSVLKKPPIDPHSLITHRGALYDRYGNLALTHPELSPEQMLAARRMAANRNNIIKRYWSLPEQERPQFLQQIQPFNESRGQALLDVVSGVPKNQRTPYVDPLKHMNRQRSAPASRTTPQIQQRSGWFNNMVGRMFGRTADTVDSPEVSHIRQTGSYLPQR